MVVVVHLPERSSVRFVKCKRRELFEKPDKFAQVASIIDAFRENVNVVRHQTKRVQAERMFGRTFEQQRKCVFSGGLLTEVWCAMVTANGYEIRLPPDVIMRRETSDFPVRGHPRQSLR